MLFWSDRSKWIVVGPLTFVQDSCNLEQVSSLGGGRYHPENITPFPSRALLLLSCIAVDDVSCRRQRALLRQPPRDLFKVRFVLGRENIVLDEEMRKL